MLSLRAYHLIKPLLPWGLRMAIRRERARRIRSARAEVWPIDERAGRCPHSWPGWPDGKQFALVLTHDVESRRGLARVKRLVDLERAYGFRSCFNFVAEGDYRVPDDLRQMLGRAGFEVGVHGLRHDSSLYASRAAFAASATRIRKYLQNWNARGFRSPLMLHRLSWLHALGVQYDSSTFDTDPFEPEPDGFGTIFPFWVPGGSGGGYVELPYTLPQDFTLFVLLRESGIDIWKRKLDWIAEHRGMALLDVHPDYVSFDGPVGRDEYTISLYEELLRYIRRRYDGAFWAARPCDVASYYTEALPLGSRNTRKRICMLAYAECEADDRSRHCAEALGKRGDHVDVIALGPRGRRTVAGVVSYGIQQKNHRHRKWPRGGQFLWFFLRSSSLLTRLHRQVRYDIIHVHNAPDFLVFAAWYPKLNGAKVILDIRSVVPESSAGDWSVAVRHPYVMLSRLLKRCSATFVNHIISSHLSRDKPVPCRRALSQTCAPVARPVPLEKCSVYLDQVDPAVLHTGSGIQQDPAEDEYLALIDSLSTERFE